jgi:hypothetical protein
MVAGFMDAYIHITTIRTETMRRTINGHECSSKAWLEK